MEMPVGLDMGMAGRLAGVLNTIEQRARGGRCQRWKNLVQRTAQAGIAHGCQLEEGRIS